MTAADVQVCLGWGNERSQVILPLFEGGSPFWHVLVQVIRVGCGSKLEDNQHGIGCPGKVA
jgi:hypothetical protein